MFKKKNIFKKEIPVRECLQKIFDTSASRFLNKCLNSVCFKKVVLFVGEILGCFFCVLLVGELLFLYSMKIGILELWMGSGRSANVFFDNFGSIFIQNFSDNYFWFIFFPLLHFLIFFSLLSAFMWIYYRDDNKLGWTGFKNLLLSLFIGFMLIYFPIKVNNFDDKVRFMKEAERASYVGITKILSVEQRREALELYHSLYLEGFLIWRHDPLVVVENELKNGRLHYYSRDDDKLRIESQDDSEEALYNNAVVVLENERYNMEINLMGKGNKENRVWVIYGYRVIK